MNKDKKKTNRVELNDDELDKVSGGTDSLEEKYSKLKKSQDASIEEINPNSSEVAVSVSDFVNEYVSSIKGSHDGSFR